MRQRGWLVRQVVSKKHEAFERLKEFEKLKPFLTEKVLDHVRAELKLRVQKMFHPAQAKAIIDLLETEIGRALLPLMIQQLMLKV